MIPRTLPDAAWDAAGSGRMAPSCHARCPPEHMVLTRDARFNRKLEDRESGMDRYSASYAGRDHEAVDSGQAMVGR